jgi:SAM-dependent methyltransferase
MEPRRILPSMSEMNMRALLREHLTRYGQINVEKNVAELFDLDMYGGRFNFFLPSLPRDAKVRMLLSGCSIGSEILVARKNGFREVIGTEVNAFMAKLGQERIKNDPACTIDLVDGSSLPYPDDSFSMVHSAHVIEHTPSPSQYFKEHMRVLKPGGFFYLEFPTRYHLRELHTGLPSLEWLPRPIRTACLRLISSRYFPLSKRTKDLYDLIEKTLQPVSVWEIKTFIRRDAPRGKIVLLKRPAPGFVQLLIQK